MSRHTETRRTVYIDHVVLLSVTGVNLAWWCITCYIQRASVLLTSKWQ